MDVNFAAIREGLRLLRERETPPRIFGAEGHGFRTNPPLAKEAVEEFQERHRIQLPEDYRSFLIHVGNGGAGPAWGMFKLGEMDSSFKQKRWKENDGFVGALSEPFPHSDSWNDLTGEPQFDESRERDQEWEDEYGR